MLEYPIHGSQWFDIREWVDPRTWSIRGIKAAEQIDPKTVRIAELLRQLIGAPVIVNNWHFWKSGPKYDSSGFRPIWDKTGGDLSQHRAGRAGDHKVAGMKPEQLLRVILENKAEFFALGLSTIEDLKFTPTWLHLDNRPRIEGVHPDGDFLIVQP